MSAVGYKDWICNQGSTWRRGVTWEGNDIEGFSVRMHVRPKIASPKEEILVVLTTENGRITLDEEEEGRMVLEIDALTTREFDAGTSRATGKKYYYDLEVEAPDGEVTRILEGLFTVFPEVTREQDFEEPTEP